MKRYSAKSVASSSLEAQLEKLLVTQCLTARWAARIWLSSELPLKLKRCIQHLAKDMAWCAYADDHQIYFVLGRSRPSVAQASHSMLEAYFLDAEATILFRGVWKFDHTTGLEPWQVPATWKHVAESASQDLTSAPT